MVWAAWAWSSLMDHFRAIPSFYVQTSCLSSMKWDNCLYYAAVLQQWRSHLHLLTSDKWSAVDLLSSLLRLEHEWIFCFGALTKAPLNISWRDWVRRHLFYFVLLELADWGWFDLSQCWGFRCKSSQRDQRGTSTRVEKNCLSSFLLQVDKAE